MMRQPRIKDVRARGPLELQISWADGTSSVVDIAPLVEKFEIFAPLEDAAFFEHARADELGWSVKWNDEIDLSSETLWRLTLEQRGDAMPAADFNRWREHHHLSLQAAADALGLSRRVIAYYAQGRRVIPKTVLLATKGYDVANGRAIGRIDQNRAPKIIRPAPAATSSSKVEVHDWIAGITAVLVPRSRSAGTANLEAAR